MAARATPSNDSIRLARLAAAIGLAAVAPMVAVQIVGRGSDQVWSEFLPLVVAGFMLGYVIRRDAPHRVVGLVVAGVVLIWVGEPAGTVPSVLLLFGGVLALATAGWPAMRRV